MKYGKQYNTQDTTDHRIKKGYTYRGVHHIRVIGIPVFSILVALEDDAKFFYNPCSFKEEVCNGKKPMYREKLLKLKKGTIVVFHPMLLHAGAGYGAVANTRLHFYILPKGERLVKTEDASGATVNTHFDPAATEKSK